MVICPLCRVFEGSPTCAVCRTWERARGILRSGGFSHRHESDVLRILRGAVGELSDLAESGAQSGAPAPAEGTKGPTSGPPGGASAKGTESETPSAPRAAPRAEETKEESEYSYEDVEEEESGGAGSAEEDNAKKKESAEEKGRPIPAGRKTTSGATPVARGSLGAAAAIGLKPAGKALATPVPRPDFRALATRGDHGGRDRAEERGAEGSKRPRSPSSGREPLGRKKHQKKRKRGTKGAKWKERGERRKEEKKRQREEQEEWRRREPRGRH